MEGTSVASHRVAGVLLAAAVCFFVRPAAAQTYSPPPSDFTTYWTEPAFKDFPYKGAKDARGILFWSHGVNGKYQQWHVAPPGVIQDFARAGWDVVKVQRNNLHENGWTASGVKHVADLLDRIKKARGDGYQHIIAAGQSYGGAISLEASASTDLLFGVIAFAPGHGSEACGKFAGQSISRASDNLQAYLVDAIAKAKAPRIVVTMADGDECQGHNNPTTMIRDALARTPAQFVFLDSTMAVRGHAAASTAQFQRWYGPCLSAFMDPGKIPVGRETVCGGPNPVPRFLLPDGYKWPAPPADGQGLVGVWSGFLTSRQLPERRTLCIGIESESPSALKTLTAFDAGSDGKLSMAAPRREFAKNGASFVYRGPESYRMVLAPRRSAREIDLTITSADGQYTFESVLKPGC
jgi:dienelactone hydrolase